ncbi:AsmA family protein [Porticoccaceae bacterium]|nr:AsmA family protein [Porticoccaceae bacterium]
MSKVIKWLLTLTVTAITLLAVAIVYVAVVIDPNDFKTEIKSAAASQGVELSLDGDLSWQFFPQIGVIAEQVEFAHSAIASGKIGELRLAVSWGELFTIDLSSSQLPVGSVEISDATILLAELAPNTFPMQLNRVNAVVKNFSMAGDRFPIKASAEVFSGIVLDLETVVALQVDSSSASVENIAVSDLRASIDGLTLSGQFSADNNFATAQGVLLSNRFDLRQLLNKFGKTFPELKMPKMSANEALTSVSWKSNFNVNNSGFSTIDTQLNIDNQPLTLNTKIDHSINNLILRVSADQFDLSGYMSATPVSSQPNAALFAPLAVPFALWLGRSQMELSLDKLKFADFDADNIYVNLFGNQKVLRLSSFNADIFSGQVNATGRVDMRQTLPSFDLQTSLTNIDLQSALVATADSSDITGLLSLEAKIQGAGNNIDEIILALRGDGQVTIADPSYAAINAEETFCNAAALFAGGSVRNDWAPGTQFETGTGTFTLGDGKLLIRDLTTATGNLSITSRGTVQLAQKRFNITANTRVNGSSTSASGCSVNKRLQNRNLPFVCTGSYNQGGKTSCKPDENLIKDMLKGSVYEKLGEQLFNTPATEDGDDQQQSDPLKSLLKGIFEQNLKK